MSTIVKNKTGLAVALSAALLLSTTMTPMAEAKAKKPTLSKTKLTITVGAKKKVTVKNAKKVTWTVSKAAKKVVSLSGASKKGATIKGKKAGKAKISVLMKNGKTKVKKTLTVTVKAKTTTDGQKDENAAPSASPSAAAATVSPSAPAATTTSSAVPASESPKTTGEAPSVAPSVQPTEAGPSASAKPTKTPAPTAYNGPTPTPEIIPTFKAPDTDPFKDTDMTDEYNVLEVNLSTAEAPGGGDVEYDEATKTLSVKETSLFTLDLPLELGAGESIYVDVIGIINGEKGFRSYLIPGSDNHVSNIVNSDEDGIPYKKEFDWRFKSTVDAELVGDGTATKIQFKGITYSDTIDNLRIAHILIAYKGTLPDTSSATEVETTES